MQDYRQLFSHLSANSTCEIYINLKKRARKKRARKSRTCK